MKVLTPLQMKQAEQNSVLLGVSETSLMINAGTAAYELIAERIGTRLCDTKFVVLCGSGNNGGDGFVTAKLLARKAKSVTVVLANSLPKTRTTVKMYEECKDSACEIYDIDFDLSKVMTEIEHCGVIIDAVFGTGFHGELPEKLHDIFDAVNSCGAVKYAFDFPSGTDAEEGTAACHSICADTTIAFAAAKTGHIIAPCSEKIGELVAVNIGIPEKAFESLGKIAYAALKDQISSLIPDRLPSSHKGDFGKLLIIAGSENMSGAAALSVKAALRSGVGICTLASVKEVINRTASAIYEPTYITLEKNINGGISKNSFSTILPHLDEFNAICIGMGMGNTDDTKVLITNILNYAHCTIIIDADGINSLASCIDLCKDTKANIVLTPHPGEMSRLTKIPTADIQNDRISVARSFAAEYGVTLVLKGANTVIASPQGDAYINTTGNAGLARGGSGDVLSGIIGAFAAQGLSGLSSAIAGTFIHGYAADKTAVVKSKQGMLPSDVIDELPAVFRELGK